MDKLIIEFIKRIEVDLYIDLKKFSNLCQSENIKRIEELEAEIERLNNLVTNNYDPWDETIDPL